MIRQARTSDTVLVESREMTHRSQTLPWWLEGGGIKTTENKIHWLRCLTPTWLHVCRFCMVFRSCSMTYSTFFNQRWLIPLVSTFFCFVILGSRSQQSSGNQDGSVAAVDSAGRPGAGGRHRRPVDPYRRRPPDPDRHPLDPDRRRGRPIQQTGFLSQHRSEV
jgi:hypothetical protein